MRSACAETARKWSGSKWLVSICSSPFFLIVLAVDGGQLAEPLNLVCARFQWESFVVLQSVCGLFNSHQMTNRQFVCELPIGKWVTGLGALFGRRSLGELHVTKVKLIDQNWEIRCLVSDNWKWNLRKWSFHLVSSLFIEQRSVLMILNWTF